MVAASLFTFDKGQSPAVGDMHDAYVVFAVVATLAVIAINVALVLAVGRYRARRGAEAAPRPPAGIRPWPLVSTFSLLATLLLTAGIVFNEKAHETPASLAAGKKPLTIRATGQQWLWRYTYPDGTFSYYELVVPTERTIRLKVDSIDTVHSWFVPDLGGQAQAVPGRINGTHFRVDEPGVYDGQSTIFSGAAFAAMRSRVRALPESQYLAWLSNQKRDLIAAQAAVAKELRQGSAPSGAPSAPLTPGVHQQTGGLQ